MDLRQLRTFISVSEEGSVSKAAQRLHIAQPALSRQIMELERELGLTLFHRIGRGVTLTRDGEQLLERSRTVLVDVAMLAEHAHRLRGGDVGLLRVAASPQIIEGVLSSFLRRYATAFPKVQVILIEAVGRDQIDLLDRGALDISIGLLGVVKAEDRFERRLLPAVDILAACHPSVPLGERGAVEITTLIKHPLLLLDPSYVFRKCFDAACRAAGVEPKVAIESRTPHTLLALAEAAYGVAVIQTAVPTNRYKLRIIRVTHRRKPIRLPMAVIWDRRRAMPRYVQEFVALLEAHMAKVLPVSTVSRR
jgi:DNA-binding transcriptional LysR family regulator